MKQISRRIHLSEYTIRYYEKEGLFPFIRRNAHGERVFEEKDLHFLEVILCLKKTGMPLEDIRQYIRWAKEGDASLQQRYQLFVDQRKRIDAQMKQLELYRSCIDYKCRYYEEALAAGTEAVHRNDKEEDLPFASIMDFKKEEK